VDKGDTALLTADFSREIKQTKRQRTDLLKVKKKNNPTNQNSVIKQKQTYRMKYEIKPLPDKSNRICHHMT
jgi:hypothetical protein